MNAPLTPADIEALAECRRFGATRTYRERTEMLNRLWATMTKAMHGGHSDAERLAALEHAMPSLMTVLAFLGAAPEVAHEHAHEMVEYNLLALAVRDGTATAYIQYRRGRCAPAP